MRAGLPLSHLSWWHWISTSTHSIVFNMPSRSFGRCTRSITAQMLLRLLQVPDILAGEGSE